MATARADTPSRSNEYPIPHRMKAWVLGGPEELALIEKPVPQPGPAEVLVRVDAIAVCATDIEIIRHGVPAMIDGELPFNRGRPDSAGAGRRLHVCRALRPFQEAGNPRLAHGLLNASTVEVQTIALPMRTLRNKAPSHSETPRRITLPAMARLRVSRSAI
jgi:hypothetical protein